MKKLHFYLYTSFVALYVLGLFVDHHLIIYIQGWLGAIALIVSFPKSNRTYQIIGFIFLIGSALIFFIYKIPVDDMIAHFTSMGLLLTLLYFIPFINHYMIVGEFDQALFRKLQSNTPNLGKFYVKTYITSYVLTIFIFISTLPLVLSLVKEKTSHLSRKLSHQLATRAILRPFAAANTWSPIEVYIAMVVAYTGSTYLKLLPILLGFSMMMLLLDTSLGYFRYRRHRLTDHHQEKRHAKSDYRKLTQLGLFLVLFITTAALTHTITNFGFFDSIILVIIPYTMAWALLTKNLSTFISYNRQVWGDHLWTMQNFIVLLVPIGIFNEIVGQTPIFETMMDSLYWLENMPILLFIFIQLSSMVLAFFGFHPLVTLGLQGLFVTPFLDTINPLSISIVMIISVIANDMTGTFNIPITMLNQYMKRNPYQLTLWNIGYALVFGGTGVLIAWMLL